MVTRNVPSTEARWEAGRVQRAQTTRRALGVLVDRAPSYDPVARLIWQGESRVASLLPIRYKRMLASPLSFFRGGALLMAEDLARGPSSGIDVQICGDAHLSNFGIFSSPERRLVFDINDFDETDQGPFEWDVKRLTSSLAVAAHQLGLDHDRQSTIAVATAQEYQSAIRRFADESRLDVWYASLDVASLFAELRGFFADGMLHHVEDVLHRAKSKESQRAFSQMLTYGVDGPRINPHPPHITPFSELEEGSLISRSAIYRILAGYATTLSSDRQRLLSQFVPVDAAHQLVGVGSVGLECYIILLVGRDEDDPFFLQVKEARRSVVSIARDTTPSTGPSERVVSGQKLMQASSDLFLGWYAQRDELTERGFYVRQLYDNKASVRVEDLDESQLLAYGRVCAWVLARAHARSGRGAEIAGYVGGSRRFPEAMAAFALSYRERNTVDYQSLASAVEEGRITVAS